MAARKLRTGALSLLSRRPSSPHLRHLSNAAAGGLKHSRQNRVSVLHFLRGRGLGDEVLAGMPPRLLDSKVGEEFPAKFDLLLTRGFSVPEAVKVLKYHISLISLQRCLDTLRTIVSDDADLRRMFKWRIWTLTSSKLSQRMVDSVSKLRGWGVSDKKIRSLLVYQTSFFQMKPQCLEDAADRAVAEFGVSRDSKTFVNVVRTLCMISESTMQSKFQVFERFGWERSGVIYMFKIFPSCINLAEATLIKKLNFLMKEVGFDPSYITKNPVLLSYNLDRRVRPRFELVNALKSKNLLPKELGFHNTWNISETKFMEKYVLKFIEEEPDMCNAYINTVASHKQQASG